MVEINITYQGELHCDAIHQPSGAHISTDAPKDNRGKGESFSPTDLVATALGSCMLTVMAIAAKSMNLDLEGAKVRVIKEMAAKPVRRIDTLSIQIDVPLHLDDEQKQKLTNAAMSCPVHKSLHPDIKVHVNFMWG